MSSKLKNAPIFFTATAVSDGQPFPVNALLVSYVDAKPEGTRIVFNENHAKIVSETVVVIEAKLRALGVL